MRGPPSPGDAAFCRDCGARAVKTCGQCSAHIQGVRIPPLHTRRDFSMLPSPEAQPYRIPAHCPQCGHAYPWTEARLKAAAELVDLAEALSAEERAQLKADLPALANEGPQSPVTAQRWKKGLAKVGGDLYGVRMKVLGDLVTASVKGQLGM
ncbi:hypothetical protein DAT35_54985 [Vitiosangium sp. GDMCC 1.1324]|nr:hypothetical protein DAT35_54985 [Vitiosangium sp. GDMCC 1.1324]